MKAKKIVSIALLAALSAGMVGGCAKTGQSDVDTIEVWSGGSHSKSVFDELVKEFNEGEGKKSGVQIKYKVIDGDGYQKSLDVALQNGQGPDLFDSTYEIRKDVENGYLLPLEELPGIDKYVQKYTDKNMMTNEICTLDGKAYKIPKGVTTQGLIYNKEMFKKAGIVDENGEAKPPETIEELREVAKKLTNPDEMEYGIIFPMKWNGWFASDIRSLGMSSFGHEGWNPATGEYEYEKFMPILNAYLGMKEDGSVFPGADGLDNDQARARFAAGKIGMKMGFSFDVGVLNDQFPAEIDWDVAPYPVIDKNNKYRQRMATGVSFAVNAKSVERVSVEKLAKVFEFFICDETVQKLFEEGVELPLDTEKIDYNAAKDGKKGWVEFSKIVEISTPVPREPKQEWTGMRGLGGLFTNEVWPGNMSVEEACKQANENNVIARDQYYSKNTNESPDDYIQPNWNIKR